MKTLYVKDLVKNQVFENEAFAIFQLHKATDKNGKPYYSLTLGDKTGSIPAKIWSDVLATINKKIIQPESVIGVSGKVSDYKGSLQLEVLDVFEVDETQLDEFIESSQYDPEDMMGTLKKHVKSIQNKDIKKVLDAMFADSELVRKFKFWPAGNSIHHGFRSGLLQHVLEMFDIANSLKHYYQDLNFDVLYAGIILHDIGKLEELSGGISSNYTRVGGLQGHITIGVQMFLDHGGSELDENIKNHIIHLILSHHGKYEFGSPVVPSTPEAVALHYIDSLSSKTRGALNIVDQIPEGTEFSPPSFYLEGARFWKHHNEGVEESQDSSSDNKQDQLSLT